MPDDREEDVEGVDGRDKTGRRVGGTISTERDDIDCERFSTILVALLLLLLLPLLALVALSAN